MQINPKYAYDCPCCNRPTLHHPPGNYEICSICFWQDDPLQSRYPTYASKTNKISLKKAKENFLKFGVAKKQRSDYHI